jgi:mRNA-degrading endonuclease RelE of RelBE toxin-antitoxin system
LKKFDSAFARGYKKLQPKQKQDVNAAVDVIVTDPFVGEPKRGDVAGAYVYKFKSQTQRLLLAYAFDPKTRNLLLLDSHENFFRELKR